MSDLTVEPFLRVPGFLKNHPELMRRGVTLATAIKPVGSLYSSRRRCCCSSSVVPQPVVYETSPDAIPRMVVKVLSADTEEAVIIEKFQANPMSPNHVVPGEVIRSAPPLLLMPHLTELICIRLFRAPLLTLIDLFIQILEVRDKATCSVH